eukprot:3529598-Amphidinium_carterae.1
MKPATAEAHERESSHEVQKCEAMAGLRNDQTTSAELLAKQSSSGQPIANNSFASKASPYALQRILLG